MKKQYILFDFDGVIVNTEPQNAHYLQETLKSFGVYMDHEELKGFIGVNSREKILHYLSRSKENVGDVYKRQHLSHAGITGIISMDEGTESESRIGNINEREIYYYGFKPDQNDRLFFSYCMWGYV